MVPFANKLSMLLIPTCPILWERTVFSLYFQYGYLAVIVLCYKNPHKMRLTK